MKRQGIKHILVLPSVQKVHTSKRVDGSHVKILNFLFVQLLHLLVDSASPLKWWSDQSLHWSLPGSIWQLRWWNRIIYVDFYLVFQFDTTATAVIMTKIATKVIIVKTFMLIIKTPFEW